MFDAIAIVLLVLVSLWAFPVLFLYGFPAADRILNRWGL